MTSELELTVSVDATINREIDELIKELQQDMTDLKELFGELNQKVLNQGPNLTSVETATIKTEVKVEESIKQTEVIHQNAWRCNIL